MIAERLYNRLRTLANKERHNMYMDLDIILKSQMGCGTDLTLVDTAPEAVTLVQENPFYIKPVITDIDEQTRSDSKVLLFSAPGATGKSALARYISYQKKALLWDLSKDKIANHGFTGMLVDSIGPDVFSSFTGGLLNGTSVLVIDALDEAEMISGRAALETLLIDIRRYVKAAQHANVVLCARTETAHYVKEFFSREGQDLPVSHYEVGFFEDSSAIAFLEKKISDKKEITPVTDQWIRTQFDAIKRLLGDDSHTVRSFLGYAPVLEALAVFFTEEVKSNTMQALRDIAEAGGSIAIFVFIMDYILEREQGKVSNGFCKRCSTEFSDFKNWDAVYQTREQLVRIADYIAYGTMDFDAYSLSDLPHELNTEYKECIEPFMKDHPFVQSIEKTGNVCIDFTGIAFRDYVLARLMVSREYSYYAVNYFTEHRHNVRFPSQLFFDFYCYFLKDPIDVAHFPYLYDSFKAKEQTDTISKIDVEEADGETTCTFSQQFMKEKRDTPAVSFQMDMHGASILIAQASNLYIDITGDVILGSGREDVRISNSTIKCASLIVNAPNIMIVGEAPGGTLLSYTGGLNVDNYPAVKFDVRADKGYLRIAAPDVAQWYKLRPYECVLDDAGDVDTTKFEYAVKTILKHFRKHGKDAPGRHYEFIQNIIIGGSELKQSILDFFMAQGVIFKDDKDTKQYKLDNGKLEKFGVNWGHISQNSIPDFKDLFEAYCKWKS